MPTLTASNSIHHPQGARHIAAFVALSLLIHGLLFFVLLRAPREESQRAGATPQAPISVRLLEAPPAPAPAQPPGPPPIASAVPPPKPHPAPKRAAQAAPKASAAPKMAKSKRPHPSIAKLEQSAKPAPQQEQSAARQEPLRAAPAEPAMDMLSMLNAARERRRAAAMENEAEAPGTASANDVALANINRDLQRNTGARTGMGNVYVRLTHTGVRTAQFQIRGWNPVSGDRWRQTIEVDAGPDGDVQTATVQKMIEWIRAHYSGDFNWESHRLDRVFTLSARPRDNAELQAFLMREFFSS